MLEAKLISAGQKTNATFKLLDSYKFKKTMHIDTISIQQTQNAQLLVLASYNNHKLMQVALGINAD